MEVMIVGEFVVDESKWELYSCIKFIMTIGE